MRAVRVLLVGLGVTAATLFTVSPAMAEQPQPAPPSTTTVKPAQPSAAPSPTVTSSPTPNPTTAPARPRPKGGVQTGGGSPESDNTGLLLGGGAAIVAGFGAFALRRRAVRGSN